MDTTTNQNQNQTNSIAEGLAVNQISTEPVMPKQVQTHEAFVSQELVDPMDIKPENSVINKTVSGGVDIAAETANAAKQAPISNSTNFADTLNNEIVKPKMNYSLIAVIAGVLVLIITATAYYFLVFSRQNEKPAPTATVETQPTVIEENPVTTPPVSETPSSETSIGSDQVINQLNTVGNSDNTTQMQQELDSIDFEGIDTSLQLSDF